MPRDAALSCAICDRPAVHRLLVPPAILSRAQVAPIGVPRERRGLCRECGLGRHSLSFVSDDELQALRRDVGSALPAPEHPGAGNSRL
jgi:hypothetical protein